MKKVQRFIERFIPDKLLYTLKFRYAFGRWINWKNPKTFNEKILWRLVYDRNPIYTRLADKYQSRKYVADKIGYKYLVPILFSGNPKKLDFNNLKPPFVIKTNHTMGDYYFVKNNEDYEKINRKEVIDYFVKMVGKNYYLESREWQYKNIKPQIVVESFLEDKKNEGVPADDFKVHCFNGKAEFINIDYNKRILKGHGYTFKRSCFDREGNGLPLEFGYKTTFVRKIFGVGGLNKNKFKEMISIAEKLSNGFDYVRVDFYYINKKIYFGEFTFTPTCGFGKFKPESWDYYFGEKWKIPNKY